MSDPTPDPRASGTRENTPQDTPTGDDARVGRVRSLALNEDWAATVVGLLILAIVLVGLWPGWLVP